MVQKKINKQKFDFHRLEEDCEAFSTESSDEKMKDLSPKKKIFKRMEQARKKKSQQSDQGSIQNIGIEEREFKGALRSLPKLAHDLLKQKETLTCKKPLEGIEFFPSIIQSSCKIVTALPMTQVSVERVFSALKFLTPDQRSHMTSDLIDDLVFLRTNNEYI